MRKSRFHKRSSFSAKDAIRTFCLLNLIPLAAVIVLGILWYRGDIVFNVLPEGTGATLGILAGLLVAIFLVASFSIPVSHDAVKALSLSLARQRAIMKGEEEGHRFPAALRFPFLWVFRFFAALLRLVLMLLAVLLMGVLGVFCVRFFVPEFLQEWIDKLKPTGWMPRSKKPRRASPRRRKW